MTSKTGFKQLWELADMVQVLEAWEAAKDA